MSDVLYKRLSDEVIGAALTVHSKLGPGLAEVLYKRAVKIELDNQGIGCWVEKEFPVFYAGRLIGRYYADIVVAGAIILEVKAVKALDVVMRDQLLNYLRISGLRVGYLCNFASNKLQFQRFVV